MNCNTNFYKKAIKNKMALNVSLLYSLNLNKSNIIAKVNFNKHHMTVTNRKHLKILQSPQIFILKP